MQPMLFDDFHIHDQAKDVIRRCARLCRPIETPMHPSWLMGASWAKGQLEVRISQTGFVTCRPVHTPKER